MRAQRLKLSACEMMSPTAPRPGPAPSHAKRDGMTDKKPEITCSACSTPRWACARVADSPVLRPCTLACPHAGGPGLGTDKEFVSNLTLLMKKCVEQHERG